jgi:dTDP-4-dehydrorhamnose reductase
MRVLILGGNGMIGHKVYQFLSKEYSDTWVTLRNKLDSYTFSHIYNSEKVVDEIDLLNFEYLSYKLNEINPDIIVNACGITIRRGVDNLKSNSIILNSALPHILNEWVTFNRKRLIHFSTDCVFSGDNGNYSDYDYKDATDIYGSSKSLGEVTDSKFAITLRGSMIGRELENNTELFEWFLKQRNKTIKGFSGVIYSGITTIKMAEIVLKLIQYFPNLSGVYNISSKAITKFDLLKLFNEHFEMNAKILDYNSYVSNKNLISSRFFSAIGLEQPEWGSLISQLKVDCIQNNNLYNLK